MAGLKELIEGVSKVPGKVPGTSYKLVITMVKFLSVYKEFIYSLKYLRKFNSWWIILIVLLI